MCRESSTRQCPAASRHKRATIHIRPSRTVREAPRSVSAPLGCAPVTCWPWLWIPLQMTMSVSLHAFGHLLRTHRQRNRRRVRPHLRKRDERPRMETVRTGRTLLRTNGTRFFSSRDSGSTNSIQRSPSTLAPIPCRQRDCWAGHDTNHTSIDGSGVIACHEEPGGNAQLRPDLRAIAHKPLCVHAALKRFPVRAQHADMPACRPRWRA